MKTVKVTTVSNLTTGEITNMYQEDVDLDYTPSSGIYNNEETNEQILTEYYTPGVWEALSRDDVDPDPELGPFPEDLAGY